MVVKFRGGMYLKGFFAGRVEKMGWLEASELVLAWARPGPKSFDFLDDISGSGY